MNPPSVDIKDILVRELGFEFAVDLFIASQPASPLNCVTIFDTSVTSPDGTIDGDNVYMYETIMFWVRNSSYEAAYLQCQSIIGALHNKRVFTENETFYLRANLQNGPNTLVGDGDGEDYSEFSMNFNLIRKSGVEEPEDFLTFVDLVSALVAGTNITLSVDLSAQTITINGEGGGIIVHDELTGRDADDQHPISAITDLQTELDSKSSESGGGFIANVYFRTDASDVATYRRISYTNELTETELPFTVNASEGDKLIRTYLYDNAIETTLLDAGVYIANYRAKVNNASGTTNLIFQAFLRHADNTETTLFTSDSPELNNTDFATCRHESNQPRFTALSTDRFGVRIYAKTTRVPDVTITTVVGGENASYFSTPIALRHSLLRNPNEAPDVQHLTAAQVALLKTTTAVEITILVADWSGGTTVTKTVAGVTATSLVSFSMSYATGLIWGAAGCWGESQDTDEITIVCTTIPTEAMTIKVINTK